MLDPAKFIPLVWSIAHKMKRRLPHSVQVDDVASSGMVGLLAGIRRYRKTRGSAMRYLSRCIAGAMLDGLRDMDHLSRNARAAIRRRQKEGQPPAATDIHDGPPRGLELEDFHLPDRKTVNPISGAVVSDILDVIRRRSGPRAALIFKLMYVDGKEQRTVAGELGISETRVANILHHTRWKLRGFCNVA